MSFFDFPEFHKKLRMIIELWGKHSDQIRYDHFLGSLYTNSTCSKHVIHALNMSLMHYGKWQPCQ